MEQSISWERNKIFRSSSHTLFIGLTECWKYAWQEEEIKLDSSIVLMIQERLSISELFKDIQDAILSIFQHRTMLWFRATSTIITSDVLAQSMEETPRRGERCRHQSCDSERLEVLSDSIECNHPSRNTSSLLYSKCISKVVTKDLLQIRVEKRIGFRTCSTIRSRETM